MAEVAGLVLAALPLLISALEHYEDAIDPITSFIHWKQELPRVIRELYMAHTSYELNLRLLLSHAVDDNAQLTDMVNDPRCDHWKSPILVGALQEHLGIAYEPGMSTIHEIAAIMIAIAQCLNISGADKVTQRGLEAIVAGNPPNTNAAAATKSKFNFTERVNFSMKRKVAVKQLQRLTLCNARLAEFIEKADKMRETTPVSHIKVKFAAPLDRIKDNASKVYIVLTRSWCAVHPTHHAGLRLEQRLVRRRRKRSPCGTHSVGDAARFGVSLLRISNISWVDTEFSIDEEDTGHQTGDSAIRLLSLPVPEITDICSAVESAAYPLLGFRLHPSLTLKGPYEVETPACALTSTHVTLGDYFKHPKDTRIPAFSVRDRYTLAINLAASLLQLSDTPWLGQTWSKQSIQFLRLRSDSGTLLDIQHPYLEYSHQLGASLSAGRGQILQRNMLALAIMLLEINSGRSIEKMRQRDDLGMDWRPDQYPDLDLVVARRWLHSQMNEGNISYGFADSIEHCLCFYVKNPESLRSIDFLTSVEDKVLKPLLKDETHFLSGGL